MATRAKKKTAKRNQARAERTARTKRVKRAALVKNLSKKGGKKRARVKSRARQAGVMGDTMSDLNQKAVSTWTDARRKR
jgi:hypothetical protein